MDRKTENLIIAAQRLAELGLHPTYVRFALDRHADQLESGDPEAVAQSIFDRAEPEWKREGAGSHGGSSGPQGGEQEKAGDDGGYDPVAEGKRMAAERKKEHAHRADAFR